MLLTVVYLLAKLTLLVCFCVFFGVLGQLLVPFGLTVLLNTCFYVLFYLYCL